MEGVETWARNKAAQDLLAYLHFAYPVILLVYFLTAFMGHSVWTAREESTSTAAAQKGPGGKLLPRDKKAKPSKKDPTVEFSPAIKSLFNWVSIGVVFTFLADAVVISVHVLLKRESNWWCGKDVAVSLPRAQIRLPELELTNLGSDLRGGVFLRLLSCSCLPDRYKTLPYLGSMVDVAHSIANGAYVSGCIFVCLYRRSSREVCPKPKGWR